MLNYKGYTGHVVFDDEARIFHGDVLGLRDVIIFQGDSVDTLELAFQESIDDYLEFCQVRGEAPETPFSGEFTLKLSPELHRKLYISSQEEGKSLNQWISEKLLAVV